MNVLMVILLLFFLFGMAVFIIYYRQTRTQGRSATFKQSSRSGTIASSSILILPLVGFLLVGADFSLSLPSIQLFPSSTHTPTGTTISVQSNDNTPTTQSGLSTDLVTKGTLTIGSDTTYPPQDFLDNKGNPTGFDIDLITAIAKRMGLKPVFKSEGYNALVSDLTNHKLDVVISALSVGVTPQADFVSYLNSQETYMVLKSNADNDSNLGPDKLCGKTVGVLAGSSALNDLNTDNTQTVACHANPITITKETDTASIVRMLLNGQLEVAYLDTPVANYYMQQYSGKFVPVGTVSENVQEGIAVRLNDNVMNQAITDAFQAVLQDGQYKHLLDKWRFTSESL